LWGFGVRTRGTGCLARPRPVGKLTFSVRFMAGTRHAVSSPGDLLFSIFVRGKRMDLLGLSLRHKSWRYRQLCSRQKGTGKYKGFRYFDGRESHWFLSQWTEKTPAGQEAVGRSRWGEEDSDLARWCYGSSTEKYRTIWTGWTALLGRTRAHHLAVKTLTDIEIRRFRRKAKNLKRTAR